MNCHSCKTPLVLVFPSDDPNCRQFDNALEITFEGGYGMFTDEIGDDERQNVIICHECAHELCRIVPWVEKLIDSRRSHSHTQAYKKAHPDHYGWDYEEYK